MNIRERFMGHVAKSESCWNWTSAIHRDGYGIFWVGSGKSARAHRFSYEMSIGPIQEGAMILHSCDNSLCVNPGHLRQGSQAENMADRRARGRTASGSRNGSKTHPERTLRGESHPRAKLSSGEVADIRYRYRNGDISQAALSLEYGVCQSMVSNIIRKKNWGNS